jgi:hypothetical protein
MDDAPEANITQEDDHRVGHVNQEDKGESLAESQQKPALSQAARAMLESLDDNFKEVLPGTI